MTGQPPAASRGLGRWRRAAAGTHLAVSLAGGALSVAASAPLLGWVTAGLLAWVLFGPSGLLWALALGALFGALRPRVSTRTLLSMYGAQPLGPGSAPQLVGIGTVSAREAPQQAAGQRAQGAPSQGSEGVGAAHPRRDMLIVLLRIYAPRRLRHGVLHRFRGCRPDELIPVCDVRRLRVVEIRLFPGQALDRLLAAECANDLVPQPHTSLLFSSREAPGGAR